MRRRPAPPPMRDADELAARREAYAREVCAGLGNPAVQAAFAAVPRERFMGAPPWRISGRGGARVSSDPAELYVDALVNLSRERSINNGLPSLHAAALAAIAPRPGETALHVGAGTGYYSALLAELVGPGGRVIGYEIEPDLAEAARGNAAPWPWLDVRAASGVAEPLPAAGVVYVSAGATHPVDTWLDALVPGGRLVFPLTGPDGSGPLLLVTALPQGGYAARGLMRVVFIPCAGARDAGNAAALARAMAEGSATAVRSLVRDDAPDESAWCIGRGWWLSTREPPAKVS